MPTYVYKREDGTKFETRQLMSDDPLDACPDTGQEVTRLISGGLDIQIKNKRKTMSEKENNDKQAEAEVTTTLGEYGGIMKRQEEAWKEKQREKED